MNGNSGYITDERLSAYAASAARLLKPEGLCGTKKLCSELSGALKRIDEAYRRINTQYGSRGTIPDSCAWLLDNRYLAVREGRSAISGISREKKLRYSKDGIIIYELAKKLLSSSETLTDERIRLFLDGCQNVYVLPSAELYLFPCALTAAVIMRIAELCSEPESAGSEMAAAFSALRSLGSFDMHTLCESADRCERLLQSDPAGIYPLMDDQSRTLYRKRLRELADLHVETEYSYAKHILAKCSEADGDARHVGDRLFRSSEKSGALYIAANILITLFLSFLCGFLAKSTAAALLLLLPFSELTKTLLDYIILLAAQPRELPRLALKAGVPDSGKTVCVISALISSDDGIQRLSRRLEELHLSNRSKSGNLFFGILADLPEADAPVTAKDGAVLRSAKNAIGALNEKYGDIFYLFTRQRVENSDGGFSGHERKRGAVLSLARLVTGRESGLRITVGNAELLRGTRFIITLDSDTVPTPESLTELIGAMLHPLNAPVIDRESGTVARGHGIIHPRMSCDLASVRKTDFSRIFAGTGGTEPYSAVCGELYMDLYSRGGFSGKGIIDAESLVVCSEKHIPDGKVLSHDALEGAFLRGAYMSRTEFSDSFPSSPLAYYRRLHRWTRGDWQNSPWILRHGPMSDIDRWKLFDSVRRSLVPVLTFVSVFLGLCFPLHGLRLAAAAAVIALMSQLLISLTEFSSQSVGSMKVRYHSRLIRGVASSFIQVLLRLWFLPYEAWICFSAALSSLWRMLISHKKLLQWETSAQTELKKNTVFSYYLNMLASVISGLSLMLISGDVLCVTVGLMWLVSPLAALALSVPAKNAAAVKKRDAAYLKGCAKDIWRYFASFCTPGDNFLPPDNYQLQPPVGLAHRSSPTNIGMALVSALCAYEMKTDRKTALTVISGILDTLEKLPRVHGHFLNWYDTRTLRPLEPRYISTVDSGNLCACLITLKNWFILKGDDRDAERVEKLIDAMDFSMLYDSSARLFHIGLDLRSGKLSPSHYDLLASEARLTSYIAVANGSVPREHWRALSRALLSCDGYKGMASWSGTMFEYLMPELFLPLSKDSLMYETAKYCVYVQKRRKSPDKLWGISESAFYSLDSALSYSYKAHGCAHLALRRGQNNELVISPYSSFLALCVDPAAALSNLHRMEALGLRGQFGFIEAIDYTPTHCRGEKGEKVRSFMAHHLGMSMLSISNYVNRNIVRELFMSEPSMSAYRCLLDEKLPINAPALRSCDTEREKSVRLPSRNWTARGESFCHDHPQCSVLSNGLYTIMLTETALTRSVWNDILIYASPLRSLGGGHGVELTLGGCPLLPEPDSRFAAGLWALGESVCEYSLISEAMRVKYSVAAAGSEQGELRIAEISALQDIQNAELSLGFEPVLARAEDHANHPAYWRLGIEAHADSGCLMLHRLRRGNTDDIYLCIACDRPAAFRADRYGALGALSSPLVKVTVPVELNAGLSKIIRFALCVSHSSDEAFAGAQRILSMPPSEYAVMPGAAASRLGMSAREYDNAMKMLSSLWFTRAKKPFAAKQKLWALGISGDMPLIYCPADTLSADELRSLTKRFILLRSSGVDCELCLVSSEGGDYLRPVYASAREVLSEAGLEALLNTDGGVRITDYENGGLIHSCASFTVGEEAFTERRDAVYRLPGKNSRKAGSVPCHAYDKEGSFVFYVNRDLPARCWSHMLTNGSFGYIAADSGCGSMWYRNAREMRISPWLNDPHAVSGGETLEYVGHANRFSLFAENDGIPCRVKFGFGFASWEKALADAAFRCTAFIPVGIDARVLIIEAKGSAAGQLLWKQELILAADDKDKSGVDISYVNHILKAANDRSPIKDTVFSACCSTPITDWTGDLYSFLRSDYDCRTEDLSVPVFAAVFNCTAITVLACGCCDEKTLIELCKPDIAFAELETAKQQRRMEVTRLRLFSAYPALDAYCSGWAAYQTIACRLLGRCSIYQSGGAVGFRDQLQDAVNMLLVDPSVARRQILTCCAHQYLEGDVMHWWHSLGDGDRGVRTRCSDDLLWLVWALCEYCEKTGDMTICDETAYYISSKPLSGDEHDRYETPLISELGESVLEHARRAVDCCAGRGRGMHGLLWFGSCDWNDGMNEINGESVWLSWFFAHTVRRFSDLLFELCKPDAERYRALASDAGKAADSAWDGSWYLRGYWGDGTPLGSSKNEYCRIDSVSQSWAAFCVEASNSRIDAALDSAVSMLYDRDNGLVKLFDSPFRRSDRYPGYIESYGAGFRENGGQYTHAAIWLAIALIKRGRQRDGFSVLNDLLPENRDLRTYAAEPFVLPADVYSAAGHTGEAGWTWYTGSSGWFFRAVYEELIGLKLWKGRVYIRPCLPDGFAGCRVEVMLAGKRREIVIDGDEILVDGEKYDGKGFAYL